MKHKLLTAASIGTVAALALTGCSASSDGGSADGDVTLQMVESLTNPARTDLLRGLLDEFEAENPGITVKLVSPPTEQADQKIQQMLQSGKGVDVLEVRDLTVGPFSNNGWLYDMKSDLADWDGWNELTENAQAAADTDGKSYFVPYGFYGLSLFYRTDLVADAGFDGPPQSWEDLLEQASAIQDPSSNVYGYAFRGGPNANSNVVAAIEAYVIDDLNVEDAFLLNDGTTIFAAPEAQDAVDTYFELFTQASPPSAVSWGYPEMVAGFTNGTTAFLLQDPEVIATVQESSLSEDQWDTAPLLVGPTGKAAQPLATAGWGVTEASEHKEEAVKLVEFLSSSGPATTFAQKNSLVPIIAGAAEDDFYKTGPWTSYVTMTENPDTYINVVQPRGVSWWTEWIQKSDQDVQKVLLGDMSTQELLASWDEYWTEKYATEKG
ncbi:sugar ABC transporter substrate-binding protein [Microbacterium esteraromaticum]|uniref:Sugar ABC transporter substrate-binding protein n=1 Tax=Microbacterium esteraromaticum TaxID=57043 RepID=A0A939ITJ8_9MICO|nr:sugar ABC transporter substrate-binding protein [Microbacterium esteraromaticum]MBN8204441.1 sugar ABC transporter substrate-binding protein [Microbacterium esteraromaticum]MBN8414595.1 sugar ABC transporter substrate-binding protein [Microbacterium esteraromaticum]